MIKALCTGEQCTSATSEASMADWMYRDVKLENVLFDHNRDMKLVDFGFR